MQSINILEYVQENVLKSLFNKVAGLKDCWKTYLLHSYLRFYFSLGQSIIKSINFPELCFSKTLLAPLTPPPLPPLMSFQNFQKRKGGEEEVSDFSHKKGGVGKIRFFLKKRVFGVCVFFVYLHHFYQYYLYITERT